MSNNTNRMFSAFLCLVCIVSSANAQPNSQILNVLASIRPLQLIVDDLAGDLVESNLLIEGLNSPHHFSLRISDRKKIDQADVIVWVGEDLERFLVGALPGRGNELTMANLPGLAVESGVEKGAAKHSYPVAKDPHRWLSLKNVRRLATELSGRLVELRPELKPELARRLPIYVARLEALEQTTRTELEGLTGVAAVYHDSFAYFNLDYGLSELVALTHVPEERLSAKRLAELKQKLTGARCMVVDKVERHTGDRYARVLQLPVVEVDLMASDQTVKTFTDYFQGIVSKFKVCLGDK